MPLILDPQRTIQVGQKLYDAFHNEGILGESHAGAHCARWCYPR